jgi:hypothetical protein
MKKKGSPDLWVILGLYVKIKEPYDTVSLNPPSPTPHLKLSRHVSSASPGPGLGVCGEREEGAHHTQWCGGPAQRPAHPATRGAARGHPATAA